MANKTIKRKTADKNSYNNDTTGVFLIIVSVFCLVCLIFTPVLSDIGIAVKNVLTGLLGYVSYPVFLVTLIVGIALVRNRKSSLSGKQIAYIFLSAVTLALILQIVTSSAYMNNGMSEYVSLVYNFAKTKTVGGLLFGIFAYAINSFATTVGSYIILGLLLVGSVMLLSMDLTSNIKKSAVDVKRKSKRESQKRETEKKSNFSKSNAIPAQLTPVTDSSLFVGEIVPVNRGTQIEGTFDSLHQYEQSNRFYDYENVGNNFEEGNYYTNFNNYYGNHGNEYGNENYGDYNAYGEEKKSTNWFDAYKNSIESSYETSSTKSESDAHKILFGNNLDMFKSYAQNISTNMGVKEYGSIPKSYQTPSAPADKPNLEVAFPPKKEFEHQYIEGDILNGDEVASPSKSEEKSKSATYDNTELPKKEIAQFPGKEVEYYNDAPLINGDTFNVPADQKKPTASDYFDSVAANSQPASTPKQNKNYDPLDSVYAPSEHEFYNDNPIITDYNYKDVGEALRKKTAEDLQSNYDSMFGDTDDEEQGEENIIPASSVKERVSFESFLAEQKEEAAAAEKEKTDSFELEIDDADDSSGNQHYKFDEEFEDKSDDKSNEEFDGSYDTDDEVVDIENIEDSDKLELEAIGSQFEQIVKQLDEETQSDIEITDETEDEDVEIESEKSFTADKLEPVQIVEEKKETVGQDKENKESYFKIVEEVEDKSENKGEVTVDNTGYYNVKKQPINPFANKTKESSEPIKEQIKLEEYMSSASSQQVTTKPKKKSAKYNAPPIDLLVNSSTDPSEHVGDCEAKARILEETLENLKLPAKVQGITQGPAVTRYELEMPSGISVKKIEGYSKDIAYALESNGKIRVETPIPGMRAVGVEVPNESIAIVSLREIIESKEFKSATSPLTIALGKDITGKIVLCALEKMPHLLIGGSTNSGKSACLNSIIISLLYKSTPDEVRLLLVDPKLVEFGIYRGMPHLLMKDTITSINHTVNALKWLREEMERRYSLCAKYSCRNLKEFNSNEVVKNGTEQKLPYIVVILDEFGDLMLQPTAVKKEVEENIMSLAQKARAAGIHLILATQRPSVNVITGTIKANLNSRIAFAVTQSQDSRTILDQIGAEALLGRGDMLYSPCDASDPRRVQGAWVTTEEVENIVNYVKDNNATDFDQDIEDAITANKEEVVATAEDVENAENTTDPLFKDAVKRVIETKQASSSMLVTRFSIGYPRAARIIDQMESFNFIGPPEGGAKRREIYISREQFKEFFGEDI